MQLHSRHPDLRGEADGGGDAQRLQRGHQPAPRARGGQLPPHPERAARQRGAGEGLRQTATPESLFAFVYQ